MQQPEQELSHPPQAFEPYSTFSTQFMDFYLIHGIPNVVYHIPVGEAATTL